MTVATSNKAYWWKDSAGKWHFHKKGAVVAPGAVKTSTTKPAGVGHGEMATGVTPTKPSKPSNNPLSNPPKPTSLLPPNPKPPVTSPGQSVPTTSTTSSRENSKAALAKVGLSPKENAKEVWKSGYTGGSAGTKKSGSGSVAGATRKPLGAISGLQSNAGRGRAAVNSGQGSAKVYDDAKSRLLKKSKQKRYR